MQIHVDELRKTGKTYTVLLNDRDISNSCFNADEEGGFVDCYETDSKGEIILEETGQKDGWVEKDVVRKRLFGEVKIIENIQKELINDRKEEKKAAEEYFKEVGAKK